jgi:hypothetical protein
MRNALLAPLLLDRLAPRTHRALATVLTLGALRLLLTLGALAIVAFRALTARTVLAIAFAARRRALLVAVIVIIDLAVGRGRFVAALVVVLVATAALVLLLEARAALFEHAEIMIGELEVIFGLHTITGKLHVARQCLVFFEQLGGIAALAIVLAIAVRTSGHALGTLPTATATAAALTIVDQQFCSLSHRVPR